MFVPDSVHTHAYFCLLEVRAMVVAVQQPSAECTAILTVCIVYWNGYQDSARIQDQSVGCQDSARIEDESVGCVANTLAKKHTW